MNLNSAYRQVGFMCKHFMVRKSSKNPKDLFCLEMAYDKSGEMASMIQLRNQQHINEVIENPKITKEYYSNEIQRDKRYIGLMQLGIEFLKMTANFEDMSEAHEIMHEKVQEEINRLGRRSRFMNRPIKFRAWNESLKEWVAPNAVVVNGLGICGFVDAINGRFHEAAPHYKFMQFTGLHDKNGKEIWEGDVVRVTHIDYPDNPKKTLVHQPFTARVDWMEYQAYFGLVTKECDETSYPEPELFHCQSAQYKVLGNIYENPELLKDTPNA